MAKARDRIGGIVLCGGASRRMGQSKAWLRAGGEQLLCRVVRVVSQVVDPVVAAAHRGREIPVLPGDVSLAWDELEDGGPLAGLAVGLEALSGRCDAAFVVSCDQPLLRPIFVQALIDCLGTHLAVVPQCGDRLHALTAVYRIEAGAVLADQLAEGDLRAQEFARRCDAFRVSEQELRAVDPELESLLNANDPEALERVRAVLDG